MNSITQGLAPARRGVQLIGIVSLALILSLTGAFAQTVQNGNFTATPSGGWTTSNGATDTFIEQGGSQIQTLPNWTVTGTGGWDCVDQTSTIVTNPANGNCGNSNFNFTTSPGAVPGGYTGGIFVADAGDPIAISQTLSGLVAGKTYSLSFYFAGAQQSGYSGASTDYWAVTTAQTNSSGTVTGTSSTVDTPTLTIGTGSNGGGQCCGPTNSFAKDTVTFTADATGYETVTFLVGGTGNNGEPPFMFLANVAVTQVPEPASLALFSVGLAGLIAMRRRPGNAA